jgi:3-deoxy-7-phosphoheptulonate synthase/chorismate mutase
MYNYELLKLLGQTDKPVLLKRGFMATLEEFILAAEYIAKEGNEQIILCERGIRTHERWTRNTMDISAVPLLRLQTPFPVIVDVSHGTGRKDIMVPMAKAALAAGAQGVMVEAHPTPALALSDNAQQMDLDELSAFHEAVFAG